MPRLLAPGAVPRAEREEGRLKVATLLLARTPVAREVAWSIADEITKLAHLRAQERRLVFQGVQVISGQPLPPPAAPTWPRS